MRVPVVVIFALVFPALFGAQPASAQPAGPPDIDRIVHHLDDLYLSRSSIARVEMTVTTPRQSRTIRMKVWTRGRDKALVVIESPARERGTASLRLDRNLWNYLPRISRTIRAPPSMMLGSWMGSDFTNDDLVHSASLTEDFTAAVAGPSRQPAGWLVRLDARPNLVGLWKRIDYVVSQDGTLPIEARYYDRRMRHARTMKFDQVRELDGRTIPTHMSLTPLDQEGHLTDLRYLDIDFDASVPESTFSLSRLEQSR